MPTTGKKIIYKKDGVQIHVWFEMEAKLSWEAIQKRFYESRLHLPLTFSKSDSLNKSIQQYFLFNFLASLHTTGEYGF